MINRKKTEKYRQFRRQAIRNTLGLFLAVFIVVLSV